MTKTYQKFRSRVSTVSLLIILGWIGLSTRLFQIMVIQSDGYREQGISQGQKNEKLLAIRGNIYDRRNVSNLDDCHDSERTNPKHSALRIHHPVISGFYHRATQMKTPSF